MTTPTLPRSHRDQAFGAAALLVLLGVLAAGPGLGPAGWLAGIGYGIGLVALLTTAVHRAGATTLGPADLVTLGRAVLVGGVAALVADGLAGADPPVVILVVLASVALLLDAVDGPVARRTGTASELGARFDMEVDAFLLLVLSAQVAALVGAWALGIGLLRYAFVAAGRATPWLRAALPRRWSGRAVAAVAGIVLVVVTAEVLARPVAVGLVAAVLALLVWSFGRDVGWLWRHARTRPAPW